MPTGPTFMFNDDDRPILFKICPHGNWNRYDRILNDYARICTETETDPIYLKIRAHVN